jgi:hypothetical protein
MNKRQERLIASMGGALVDSIDLKQMGAIVIFDVQSKDECIFTEKPTTRRALFDDRIVPFHPKQQGKLSAHFKGSQAH